MVRKAVEAALQIHGVRSVRSELEIEPAYARYPSYPYRYHPYPLYGYGYGWGIPYGSCAWLASWATR